MSSKKTQIKVLGFVVVAFLFFGFYQAYRAGQGSTSEVSLNNHIFLGTRFGIGVKETSEALALMNARLLSADEYLAASDIKLLELNTKFISIHPSWEKWEEYYMPAIILFDSFVEADFNFIDDALVSMGVHFSPFAKSKSQTLVDVLDKEFKTKYIFEEREESDTIAGAYTLKYRKNEAIIQLWINLTDSQNPIIIAYIRDDFAKENRDQKRKEVDSRVF